MLLLGLDRFHQFEFQRDRIPVRVHRQAVRGLASRHDWRRLGAKVTGTTAAHALAAFGLVDFGKRRDVPRAIPWGIRIREILRNDGLPPTGMGRERVSHPEDIQVRKHRGFSLDPFQSRLNGDSFRNGLQLQNGGIAMDADFGALVRSLETAQVAHPVGRVSEIKGCLVRLTGLADAARIGDRVVLPRRSGRALGGEVLQLDAGSVAVLLDSAPDGIAMDDRGVLHPASGFAPADHWVGRLIDPYGNPLDGAPLLPGKIDVDVMRLPPAASLRRPLGQRLETGLAVLNTLLPIVEGQRIGLFAGSGVGKSRLLAHLARHMQADVIVVALIGERGREVNDFVNRVLGPEGMRRAVVVAATSDQSALARRRCGWAAMTVAEHFRDKGRNVLFLADSVTRFAEAHREIAVASGEAPALRGFPPSVTAMITGLCERAGPGAARQGFITAVYSVLVAGSDMEEPVADILRGVLDGHIVLDREIAERGRYPAIDVGRSVSRSLPDAASAAENLLIAETRRLLGAYERSEVMIKAGLYSEGADATLDQAVRLWPELDAFVSRLEPGTTRDSYNRLELILRRAVGPRDR